MKESEGGGGEGRGKGREEGEEREKKGGEGEGRRKHGREGGRDEQSYFKPLQKQCSKHCTFHPPSRSVIWNTYS